MCVYLCVCVHIYIYIHTYIFIYLFIRSVTVYIIVLKILYWKLYWVFRFGTQWLPNKTFHFFRKFCILYYICIYIFFFYNCFEQLCDMNSRKVLQVTYSICYYTYTSTSISTLLVTAKLTSLYQYVPSKLCIAAFRMICMCCCFDKTICYINKCKYKLLKGMLIILVSL